MDNNKSKIKRVLFGSLILVVVIVVTVITFDDASNGPSTPQDNTDKVVGTAVGEYAPEFVSTTLEGETLHLSDLKGQLVVINLFASWCGPCRLETPHLVETYHYLDDKGTAILGLNLNEPAEAVTAFKEEFDIPYPLVMDPGGKITSELYRPIGLPTTWFIDQDGVIRYVFSGAMTQEVLMQIIEDVRAGREPNPFAQSS